MDAFDKLIENMNTRYGRGNLIDKCDAYGYAFEHDLFDFIMNEYEDEDTQLEENLVKDLFNYILHMCDRDKTQPFNWEQYRDDYYYFLENADLIKEGGYVEEAY